MNRDEYDFPVDLVYLWCDDGDENWRNKRLSYQQQCGQNIHVNATKGRFESHDELKYSLRSVEKNVPWINHIYIITDGQIPSFVNLNHPKITIVDHKDVLPHKYLPLFNSSAIEFGICNIPNLSEHFLFANDDMLFAAPHDKSFYFTPEGKPIHRVLQSGKKARKYHIPLFLYWLLLRFIVYLNHDMYLKICLNGIDRVMCRTGKLFLFSPGHGIDPYRTSLLKKYNSLPWIQNAIVRTLSHKFRSTKDLHRSVYLYLGLAFDEIEKAFINSLRFPGSDNFEKERIDLAYITDTQLFEKYFHGVANQLCLNDTEDSSSDFGKSASELLSKLFPEKSQFEI